jgi:hypothetical protein
MVLKFAVHEGFLGEFIIFLELCLNYVWLCILGRGGEWSVTLLKDTLVLPISSHLPGKEEKRFEMFSF